MLFRIALCDDEETMRNSLTEKIVNYMVEKGLQYKITTFSSAEDLIDYSKEHGDNGKADLFDIIFLDIQMKQISGLEAAKILRRKGSHSYIIFVTVTKDSVFDAFQVEASGYLIKPISADRLAETMGRVISKINKEKTDILTIQKGMWCKTIKFTDIIYCEVINRKIFIHTSDEVIDYYNKIENLEVELRNGFYRCHRSYIVNLDYVCGYHNDMAQLDSGEQIPISRGKKHDFIEAVLRHMKGD